jgi:cytochrome c peroxidase
MLLSKVSTYLALFSAGAVAFAPSLPTRVTSVLAAHNGRVGDLIDDGGRRAFLVSSVITTLVGAGAPAAYAKGKKGVNYKNVAGDIASIIKDDPNKGPTLVRLAWHSSGTYDKMSKDGGSGGGTIRFKEELAHGGNAGLAETAVPWLEELKTKYGDSLSYADVYTLAGG